MTLFEHYHQTFLQYGDRIAFEKEGESYTYSLFLQMISGIRRLLEQVSPAESKEPVAVMCHNNPLTYASVFACWFSGHPHVPLNPSNPSEWNRRIMLRTGTKLLLDSNPGKSDFVAADPFLLNTSLYPETPVTPPRVEDPGDLVYILTTSGTTGEPRNVPVSLKNLGSFIRGFLDLFPLMDENDRFLQAYDLTADASFTAFLVPLFTGATVILPPDHPFRYLAVAKALLQKEVTWVQVTPTLLACLQPYFSSMRLEKIKYSHFGGEALPENLINEFRTSVPNAEIANVYGPTETTITAMIYQCRAGEKLRSYNGTVSIGKPIGDTEIVLEGDDGNPVSGCGEGELLIGGSQVMKEYYNSPSAGIFRYQNNGNSVKKYYRTGDKVHRDKEGFCYFLGRMNNQVKISGFRVDLTEVESVLSRLAGNCSFTAVAPEVSPGKRKLVAFTTAPDILEPDLKKKIRESYPEYLVPERIITLETFPLGLAGKTDRKELEQIFLSGFNHE